MTFWRRENNADKNMGIDEKVLRKVTSQDDLIARGARRNHKFLTRLVMMVVTPQT